MQRDTAVIWGEVQRGFGRLEAAVSALDQRVDDTRRELLGHIGLLYQGQNRLQASSSKPERSREPWWGRYVMRHLPWDRIILGSLAVTGASTWFPQVTKVLSRLFGP